MQPMTDNEMRASGWMNPDEQEQWDHVTEMMATAPPHQGSDEQWKDTGDDGDDAPYLTDSEYDEQARAFERDQREFIGPRQPKPFTEDEIPF